MASIQPIEKSESGVDSVSSTNELENTPPQNLNEDSVSVKIESPSMEGEQPAESTSKQTPKLIYYPFLCLLFICLLPVAYAGVTIATVVVLPLLLAAFVVVRLLQFVLSDKHYNKHYSIKFLLRYWIIVAVMLLLLELGLFYPIAKHVSGLKGAMILGLPVTKWIKIICMISGIYLLNQTVWFSIALPLIQGTGDYKTLVVVLETIPEIIGCLLFWWAEVEVMKRVIVFKHSKIFGVRTQEWLEVLLFVLIGYNIIALLSRLLVWSLQTIFKDNAVVGKRLNRLISLVFCNASTLSTLISSFDKRYVVYVAGGIYSSIVFTLSALMLLLTWVFFFGPRLNTTSVDKRVKQLVTRTLVSFLIFSFLWLIKSCIMLYWEAHATYDRLHSKITDLGKQLYFLVLLSYTHFQKVFEEPVQDADDSPPRSGCGSSRNKTPPEKKAPFVYLVRQSETDFPLVEDRGDARDVLVQKNASKTSVDQLQLISEGILSCQYALSKEDIDHDHNHLKGNNFGVNNEDGNTIEILKKIVLVEGIPYTENDWKIFLDLIPDVHTTEDITFDKVKTWMERANSRCRFLANTLISAKEVSKCLDQVMSWLIFSVVFIIWLLISGLASTKVLVLIASPLLGATFIFGDTAKGLFQGLFFIFIVHPFDIGDLCEIDGKLLEVKRIGVWSTAFSKVRTVGKRQEILYPNSALASKNVTNYKTEFDWDDCIQFSLSSPDEETTTNLKLEIETYLDTEKERFAPHFHGVEFLEIGKDDKVAVHIRYKVQTEGWTFFECLKEKEKRRFEFAVYLRNLLKQLESKTKTSEISVDVDQDVTRDD